MRKKMPKVRRMRAVMVRIAAFLRKVNFFMDVPLPGVWLNLLMVHTMGTEWDNMSAKRKDPRIP